MEIKNNTLVVALGISIPSGIVGDMGFAGTDCKEEDLLGIVVDVDKEEKVASVQTDKGCFAVAFENIVPLAEDVPEEYQDKPLTAFRQFLPEIIKTITRNIWAMEQVHKPAKK